MAGQSNDRLDWHLYCVYLPTPTGKAYKKGEFENMDSLKE